MRKLLIAIIIIFSCSFAYSNEVQNIPQPANGSSVQNEVPVQPDFSIRKNIQKKGNYLKRINTLLNVTFMGCIFLEYALIMTPFVALSSPFIVSMFAPVTIFAIVVFLEFFIAGLTLTPLGSVKYQKHKTKFSPIEEIYILLKHQQKMKSIAMVSGIINAAGATIGGAGAGMICAAVLDGDKSELFTGGIVCAVVGGIALAVCLPLMITSLAMYGWCRGEINRLGVDFAVVPDDSCSNKQTLPNWKNCKLSLACNVRF